MIDPRQVPADGVNPYANHPGFDAQGCELQYTVTRHDPWGSVGGGFGCKFNGGHCLPGDQCQHRRDKSAQEAAFMKGLSGRDVI